MNSPICSAEALRSDDQHDDSLDLDNWQEQLLDLTASTNKQINGNYNKHSNDDNYDTTDQEKAGPSQDNQRKLIRVASTMFITQNAKVLVENSIMKSLKGGGLSNNKNVSATVCKATTIEPKVLATQTESQSESIEDKKQPLSSQAATCIRSLRPRRYIVCTRFHSFEVDDFESSVRRLGGFTIENAVTFRTTHLIAAEPKRTLNLMRAIIRGCWILKPEWLIISIGEGKWIPEEDFELTNFSPAVKECRKQRQEFELYSMDLFSKCGPIYVAHKTAPPRAELEELIKLCKGRITRSIGVADIVIGNYIENQNTCCVKEQWVFDSICANRLKSLQHYYITGNN